MLDRVLSGGQTGADQAGWRSARACGLAIGGWMSLGFLTEDEPRPEFAELYGAVEMPTADYPSRTRRNVFED
jgi:Circularly permutated YpsA SLOG family